jgi:large subunit ribosomal protein L29
MSKISIDDLKNLTIKELEMKLNDYREELKNLRFQMVTGKIENVKRKWFVKKKIAQILTLLNEYKLGIRKPIEKEQEKPKSKKER